jgi:hypothetical protein
VTVTDNTFYALFTGMATDLFESASHRRTEQRAKRRTPAYRRDCKA